MASVKCAWVRCRWKVKDGGEIWPLSVYPLTLGWVPDRCWEGFAPLEVEGHQDWELALWEAERVSVAVWSELIKAGAESGTVAVSRVEWTGWKHTEPWFSGWLSHLTEWQRNSLLLLPLLQLEKEQASDSVSGWISLCPTWTVLEGY